MNKIFCFIFILPFFVFVDAIVAQEPPVPQVHVNQLGYLPAHPKVALVSSPLGLPFQIQSATSEKIILKGMLELNEANDASSSSHVWKIDFSTLNQTGSYRITVDGIGQSFPFVIQNGIYEPLAYDALKAFYYFRSAHAVKKPYSNYGERPASHVNDAILFGSDPANPVVISVTGGWYDGSDLGKYVVNGAFAAGNLLLLHEMLPQHFPDQSLNIPESGNGVPDILDEVRWEIEWLLKMQADDGGIYHKVTSLEPPLGIEIEEDQSPRYVFAKSTAATAASCALFAKASRLYSPYDATFAVQTLSAAKKAWLFLEQNENDQGFENPKETLTEAYRDINDSDERFWAATELYLATKELPFANLAAVIADKRVPLFSTTGYWGNVMPIAIATIIQNVTNEEEFTILSEVKQDLLTVAESIYNKIMIDGYQLSIDENNFTWGSNAAILQNALILIVANHVDPNVGFDHAALKQLHYILGRNPLSQCYVTGYGENPPKNLHNMASVLPNHDKILPGLLVGGPNANLNDSALKSNIAGTAPPATAYVDMIESFSSNEVSISWNASLVFVSSFFTAPPPINAQQKNNKQTE